MDIEEIKKLIPNFILKYLNQSNFEINESYIKSLIEYRNPLEEKLTNGSIARLVSYDFFNKMLYSYDKGLGKIVCYKNNEVVLYDDIYQAIMQNYDTKYIYGFETLHSQGIIPTKKAYNFFGSSITVFEPVTPLLNKLNIFVSFIYSWKHDKRAMRVYKDYKKIHKFKHYNEFVAQYIKYYTFSLGDVLSFVKCKVEKEKEQIKKRSSKVYDKCIEKLLKRYTLNKRSYFEEVENINDYKKYSGIYILCFNDKKAFYIGKTSVSLKDRIIKHFSNPQTGFEQNNKIQDISKIYVLKIQAEFLDYVERDCIASIPSEYLLNVLEGGNTIESIHSNQYNPAKNLLSKKAIRIIIKD